MKPHILLLVVYFHKQYRRVYTCVDSEFFLGGGVLLQLSSLSDWAVFLVWFDWGTGLGLQEVRTNNFVHKSALFSQFLLTNT